MAGLDYHVFGLVPASSLDLADAMRALEAEGYSVETLASATDQVGFRVTSSAEWGINLWMEDDEEARQLNVTLAAGQLPPGVSAEDVASRPGHLSIWSDDDDDLMWAHIFEEVIQLLKERFGVLLWDNRLGIWR